MVIFVNCIVAISISREMANISNTHLTHALFNYTMIKTTKGRNMKAMLYVSLLWVVLGILISFVAV
tara:strand:- start:146 stop:343 length:198 start_codon:yes stop_codon:yes gene_type:complete